MTTPVPGHQTPSPEAPHASEDPTSPVIVPAQNTSDDGTVAAARKGARAPLLILAAFLAAAVIAVTVAVVQVTGREEPEVDEAAIAESQALAACEDYVLANLKAPATAVFASASASTGGGGRYSVHGEVDAQNGFGALIRTGYHCVVDQRQGDWALVDLTFT